MIRAWDAPQKVVHVLAPNGMGADRRKLRDATRTRSVSEGVGDSLAYASGSCSPPSVTEDGLRTVWCQLVRRIRRSPGGVAAAYEGENCDAVALAYFVIGVEAQADVVIAPDAHGLHLLKKDYRFLDPLAHLENVAEDHEPLGPVLSQDGDGLAPWLRLLVDVGQ